MLKIVKCHKIFLSFYHNIVIKNVSCGVGIHSMTKVRSKSKPNSKQRKAAQKTFERKFSCKMLMKFKPGWNKLTVSTLKRHNIKPGLDQHKRVPIRRHKHNFVHKVDRIRDVRIWSLSYKFIIKALPQYFSWFWQLSIEFIN